jgi:plastocyanin
VRRLIAALLAALLAGCAAAGPSPASNCVTADHGLVRLSADDLLFSADCIRVPAGEPFAIEFTNLEDQPHNVQLFRDATKSEELARGEIITGPNAVSTLAVQPLRAGQYYFDCLVHPAMKGILIAG